MSGENEQQTAVSDDEQQKISAAFNAAFEDDEDDKQQPSQPTETPADEQQPEAPKSPEPPEATAAPAPAPAPEPKVVQITEEEWTATKARAAKVDEIEATWSKRFDQTFGKIGGLERKIAEITKATPTGEAVQLDEADFAELKEQYPELTTPMLKGLNKVLGKVKGTGGADPEAVDRLVQERVQEFAPALRKEIGDSALNAIVPDWEDEVKTERFVNWLKGQPDEVKALADSNKYADAAKLLRAYDKSLSAPPPPAATPAPTAAPAQPSTRQRQIAAAVNPKGEGSAPAPKAKSPFQEAFEEDD